VDQMTALLNKVRDGYGRYAPIFLSSGYTGASLACNLFPCPSARCCDAPDGTMILQVLMTLPRSAMHNLTAFHLLW
jgi:hypothetical protein